MMKYKDYLAEEELKHKLYTKEEVRELRAQKKANSNKDEKDIDDGSVEDVVDKEGEKDAIDSVDSVISEIRSALVDVTENSDIVADGDIYIAKQDAKEYLGYFIYKKEIGDEQDDFYVGKFIYRIKEQKLESLVDEIKDSFKSILDAERYIESYKGVKA